MSCQAKTLALALFLAAPIAHAQVADREGFHGVDKALHFSLSAGLAGSGYATSALQFDDVPHRILAGTTVALAAGLSKEFWDQALGGVFSWHDIAADALGAATGLLVAWAIDRLLQSAAPILRPEIDRTTVTHHGDGKRSRPLPSHRGAHGRAR